MARGLYRLAFRPQLPRRTVRLRLTLLYGGLFIVSGAALLTITYVLVDNSTGNFLFVRDQFRGASPHGLAGRPASPAQMLAQAAALRTQATRDAQAEHGRELHQLLIESGLALAIMAVVSLMLGWWLAGRVLEPLRTMTAATQRISEDNLHQRLALEGPSDELKDLADTIDGLLARLEAAFEAQRRFVANASHELRTPLAMMRTSLDVAAGKPERPPPELTALDHKLRQGLDQADRLVEGFLTLARAQNGALADRATVSLKRLVDDALDAQRDAIAERGLTVEEALGAAPVRGNRTLLSRMVGNVVDNAVRHNRPAGWLTVRTGVDGAVASVIVDSGGQPLVNSQARELGMPFHRVAGSRTGSDHGVGLGLSIVTAIAQAHGGSVSLEPHPGGGLRVTIQLPVGRPSS